jgi:hypothetical protein
MKRQIVLIFAAVVFVVAAGLAIGEDEKKKPPKPDKSKQVKGEKRTRPENRRPGRAVGPGDRPADAAGDRPAWRGRSGFDQQFEQKGKQHKAEMKQLNKIKKMAVEEKATKTAEMIQKLIDKKQKAFDEIAKQSEERRERFMKMMEERGDRRPGREGRRRGPRPERERKGDPKKKVEKDKDKDKDKD